MVYSHEINFRTCSSMLTFFGFLFSYCTYSLYLEKNIVNTSTFQELTSFGFYAGFVLFLFCNFISLLIQGGTSRISITMQFFLIIFSLFFLRLQPADLSAIIVFKKHQYSSLLSSDSLSKSSSCYEIANNLIVSNLSLLMFSFEPPISFSL